MIYAFRLCRAQQWQCDVRMHTSSFLSLLISLLPGLQYSLCGRVPTAPLSDSVSRLLFARSISSSVTPTLSTSSSSGRFPAVAVRPCNAAGTAVEPCFLSPPSRRCLRVVAAVAAPLQLQQRRRQQQRLARTPLQRVAAAARRGGNYEVVAAALVHLVVRGRDIGLPRSTLPVRYSFLASLMHYTRLSASVRVVVPLPLPSCRPSPFLALSLSLL